jgi:hypothetical protein
MRGMRQEAMWARWKTRTKTIAIIMVATLGATNATANPSAALERPGATGDPSSSKPAATDADFAPRTSDPLTLQGEVVETGCFVIGNRFGPRHRQCAIASSRAGQDLGIVDAATGILYVEIRDQEKPAAPSRLLPHIARQVEVRAQVVSAGSLQGITINRVRELD